MHIKEGATVTLRVLGGDLGTHIWVFFFLNKGIPKDGLNMTLNVIIRDGIQHGKW